MLQGEPNWTTKQLLIEVACCGCASSSRPRAGEQGLHISSGKTDAKRASQTARMPGHSLALHHDQTKWAQSDHG
jgi:hypothetical protein